jgi:hypothetical protein
MLHLLEKFCNEQQTGYQRTPPTSASPLAKQHKIFSSWIIGGLQYEAHLDSK